MENKILKDKKPIIIFALIAVLSLFAVYFILTKNTPNTTPEKIQGPTSKWTKVTINEDKVTLSYPPEWQLVDCPQNKKCQQENGLYLQIPFTFTNKESTSSYYIKFESIPNNSNLPFQEFATQQLTQDEKNNFSYNSSNINSYTVYTSTSLETSPNSYNVFMTKNNNRYLKFTLTPYSTTSPFPQQETFKNLLEKIIETVILKETPSTQITKKVTKCTLEAKICPDGTAVGRTGPDCSFAPCPTLSAR